MIYKIRTSNMWVKELKENHRDIVDENSKDKSGYIYFEDSKGQESMIEFKDLTQLKSPHSIFQYVSYKSAQEFNSIKDAEEALKRHPEIFQPKIEECLAETEVR